MDIWIYGYMELERYIPSICCESECLFSGYLAQADSYMCGTTISTLVV